MSDRLAVFNAGRIERSARPPRSTSGRRTSSSPASSASRTWSSATGGASRSAPRRCACSPTARRAGDARRGGRGRARSPTRDGHALRGRARPRRRASGGPRRTSRPLATGPGAAGTQGAGRRGASSRPRHRRCRTRRRHDHETQAVAMTVALFVPRGAATTAGSGSGGGGSSGGRGLTPPKVRGADDARRRARASSTSSPGPATPRTARRQERRLGDAVREGDGLPGQRQDRQHLRRDGHADAHRPLRRRLGVG